MSVGGQRTTLDVNPCPQPCLGKGVLSATVFNGLAGPCLLGIFLSLSPILQWNSEIAAVCNQTHIGVEDSNSDLYTGKQKLYPTSHLFIQEPLLLHTNYCGDS